MIFRVRNFHYSYKSYSKKANHFQDYSTMQRRIKQLIFFTLSFIIVALAQPDWSVWGCVLASCVGYALFWKGALICKSKKGRFFLAFFWFFLVSACHLNWFFADRYVGMYIYPFLILLFAGLGVQFAIVTLFINHPKQMGIVQMLGVSGVWTIFEWIRLFLLSGFSWDPVGLALTGTLTGMQMASVVGIYGLSFWIFFTNLLALRILFQPAWLPIGVLAAVMGTPYLFGYVHLSFHASLMRLYPQPILNTLLVQTSLIPEQKQI